MSKKLIEAALAAWYKLGVLDRPSEDDQDLYDRLREGLKDAGAISRVIVYVEPSGSIELIGGTGHWLPAAYDSHLEGSARRVAEELCGGATEGTVNGNRWEISRGEDLSFVDKGGQFDNNTILAAAGTGDGDGHLPTAGG